MKAISQNRQGREYIPKKNGKNASTRHTIYRGQTVAGSGEDDSEAIYEDSFLIVPTASDLKEVAIPQWNRFQSLSVEPNGISRAILKDF